MTPERFRIAVPDDDLSDLRRRLERPRLAPDVVEGDWSSGVPSGYLGPLLGEWRDGYDWRRHEAEMNEYEHFRLDLRGQPIHYLRVRRPGATPLLLIGGWPQTFWDFREVIPRLPEFELLVPDVPGQGWSSPLTRAGVGVREAAAMYHELMTQVLGHSRYGVYGTDWGALIGGRIALEHPESVIGFHTTMPMPLNLSLSGRTRDAVWSEDEAGRKAASERQAATGSGYLFMHTTRPATVGALGDSPAAMAAWLVDKVYQWSDHRGDLEEAYPRESLLTLLSIFWFTNTLGSSARFYAESIPRAATEEFAARPVVRVPTAVAAYPAECGAYPRAWMSSYFNLRRYRAMDRGGHFPQVESPQTLAADIAEFFAECAEGAVA